MILVDKLDFAYDGRLILKDVNLHVSKGELVAIFGPNGGGKTTLLSLLLGFLKPLRGKIVMEGSIAYVPQNFSFDPLFPISVYDVVALANKANAIDALEKVGMKKQTHAPFAALSGGQRQRVLLARALAMQSKILLLDEPVANLDPEAQEQIYSLLNGLKGEITILMITHDLAGAEQLADTLYCMQQNLKVIKKDELCHHFSQGLYHKELE